MAADGTAGAAPTMHVVATAGHVDHGKSALLKELTGQEPDRWAEERRRGLTIDLGYVWTDLETPDGDALTVAFVDVPGHDGFLTNMLSGVGVVRQALFVVAADDGWSAQSEEHLEILDLLGRRGVAAVVTKADLAGPDRTAEVVADVRRRLASTSLGDAPVLAVDSLSGTGIDVLRTTLAERLAAGDPGVATTGAVDGSDPDLAGVGGPRLWIDRAFTVTGAGTVVTGLLEVGHLAVGDEVTVAPAGRRGRVRGLQALGRPVEAVGAVGRVAVNLAGVEADEVERGDVLVARTGTNGARSTGLATTSLDAELRALPHSPIGHTGAWHLHVGTATTTVTVRPLLGELAPGDRGHARLDLANPLPVRVGDRFVLREAGRRATVGGGVVLDPAPGPRPRGTERRLAHALVLDELAAAADQATRLVALVDAHGGRRSRDELAALLGPAAVTDEALVDVEALTTIADQVVRRDQVAPWTDAILAAAEAAPAEHAVERARLAAAAAERGCPRELAPALIDRAVVDGALASYGGRLVHHRHEPGYLDARARRRAVFLAALEADPWQPPDPGEASAAADIPSFEVQALIDDGEVVSCGPLLFAATAIPTAVDRLRDGPGAGGQPFTASQARDAWGCTRRSAMPLLEHLRGVGQTTFDGERHRLSSP